MRLVFDEEQAAHQPAAADEAVGAGQAGATAERSELMKPRIMWADIDPEDRETPVVIYATKTEQRMNRPDLKAIKVIVTPFDKAPAALRRSVISSASKIRRGSEFAC